MDDEIVDLYVEICSDGTLLCYNPDKTLNLTFTDVLSFAGLKNVYDISKTPSEKRRDLDKDANIKYVKYYFVNVSTRERMELSEKHIPRLIANFK